MLFALNKDGKALSCVDRGKLYALTGRDTYPFSRMDERIDKLEDANFFSTTDCNSGHQYCRLNYPKWTAVEQLFPAFVRFFDLS